MKATANRSEALRELLQLTRRAAETNAPWYLWILDRQAGTHRHELRDERSRRIACPVAGCRALDGVDNPHVVAKRS